MPPLWCGLELESSFGLVDTGAEDAVVGERSLPILTRALKRAGRVLPDIDRREERSASGIGGTALVLGTVTAELGIGGNEITLPFKVIKDANIPPLLPSTLFARLQAVISYPEQKVQALGTHTSSDLCVLPSGHVAVSVVDFPPTAAMESPVTWRAKQYFQAMSTWLEAPTETEAQACKKLLATMPVERVARLPVKCWNQLLDVKVPVASGRTNVTMEGTPAHCLTLGACTSRGPRITTATKGMSSLLQLAHEIAQERPHGFRVPYLACTINTSPLPPHHDNN
eukprot:6476633-Amphidinium_carterae.1